MPRAFRVAVVLAASGLLARSAAAELQPSDTRAPEPIVLAEAVEIDRPERERPSAQPAAAERQLGAEEIVQAIKLRAQRELAKRRARKWSLSTLTSWTAGSESNPNLTKQRSSALFSEEYFSTTFSYRVFPKLTWQAGYSLDAYLYNEFTDLSTITNSLTSKLIYRIAKPLRIEAHYTFDDSDYPNDGGASTWDQKVHLRLRHSFLKRYYHYAGWTYLHKQYKDKMTRDGAGTRVPTKYRKDDRHTTLYEIGGSVTEQTLLRLRQEFYFNDSNDALQDFYDAQDYKVRLTGTHDWSDHWASTAGFTYELKRYERRNVTERGVAQQDYTKTYELGTTYKFTPRFDATYTWKYRKNDSNDPAQAYQDITNSLALTASF